MNRYYTLKVDNAGTLIRDDGRPLENQVTWEVFDRETGDPVAIFDKRSDARAEARNLNFREEDPDCAQP